MGYKEIFESILQSIAVQRAEASAANPKRAQPLWLFRFSHQIAKFDPYTYHDMTSIVLVAALMAALAVCAARSGQALRQKRLKV
jgi:hypothetical protein